MDLAAGDQDARVSGGLGGEVVPLGVDHHGLADDLLERKAVCQDSLEGIAISAGEEGREVPGMVGMGAVIRVIVALHMGGRVVGVVGGAASDVDVKGKDAAAADFAGVGEAKQFCLNQHAPVRLKKADLSGHGAAPDDRPGPGLMAQDGKRIHVTRSKASDALSYAARG